jgi:glycosyltransferase involved in cell wall biosynthesis
MPTFSIITINYNNLEGLKRTMQSVFSQSFKDYEYLIIDGGSTDGSKDWISQHSDRLAYWVAEPDNGIYDAMNKGILKASGEYILLLNSGDTYHTSEVLDSMAKVDNKYDVVYGNVSITQANKEPYLHLYPKECSLHFFLRSNICHQSTRIRARLQKSHLYDTSFKIVSDWVWFLERFEEGCTFYYLNQTVVDYPFDGISSTQVDLVEEERNRVIKKRYAEYYSFAEELKAVKSENYELKRQINTLYNSRWIKLLKKLGLTKI